MCAGPVDPRSEYAAALAAQMEAKTTALAEARLRSREAARGHVGIEGGMPSAGGGAPAPQRMRSRSPPRGAAAALPGDDPLSRRAAARADYAADLERQIAAKEEAKRRAREADRAGTLAAPMPTSVLPGGAAMGARSGGGPAPVVAMDGPTWGAGASAADALTGFMSGPSGGVVGRVRPVSATDGWGHGGSSGGGGGGWDGAAADGGDWPVRRVSAGSSAVLHAAGSSAVDGGTVGGAAMRRVHSAGRTGPTASAFPGQEAGGSGAGGVRRQIRGVPPPQDTATYAEELRRQMEAKDAAKRREKAAALAPDYVPPSRLAGRVPAASVDSSVAGREAAPSPLTQVAAFASSKPHWQPTPSSPPPPSFPVPAPSAQPWGMPPAQPFPPAPAPALAPAPAPAPAAAIQIQPVVIPFPMYPPGMGMGMMGMGMGMGMAGMQNMGMSHMGMGGMNGGYMGGGAMAGYGQPTAPFSYPPAPGGAPAANTSSPAVPPGFASGWPDDAASASPRMQPTGAAGRGGSADDTAPPSPRLAGKRAERSAGVAAASGGFAIGTSAEAEAAEAARKRAMYAAELEEQVSLGDPG